MLPCRRRPPHGMLQASGCRRWVGDVAGWRDAEQLEQESSVWSLAVPPSLRGHCRGNADALRASRSAYTKHRKEQ